MRQWKAICTHAEKDKLGQFLHELLLFGEILRRKKNHTEESTAAAFRQSKEMTNRETPMLIVTDIKDDEGNFLIVNAETGEIMPYVAIAHTIKGVTNWTAAYYLAEEPKENKKETFREESLF